MLGPLRPLLGHEDGAVREHALALVRNVAAFHGGVVAESVEGLLPALLGAAAREAAAAARRSDEGPAGGRGAAGADLRALAEEALQAVAADADPDRALAVVCAGLPGSHLEAVAAGAEELVARIKCAGAVFRGMPPGAVLRWCPRVVGPLGLAMGHDAADVRKATVFAVLDMFASAGDAVLVHLAPHIADSHMRLVRLYIDRMHGGGVAR